MSIRKTVLSCALALVAATSFAAPPNTVTLDGRPIEYDPGELRGVNTAGAGTFGGANVISNLFVTWDDTYLYIMLQGFEANNKLSIQLDVDPIFNSTGADTTTNWVNITPDFIRYNDVGWTKSSAGSSTNFGLDYMIASEGFFNNITRVLYEGTDTPTVTNVESLFDSGNGAAPIGSPVDMVVQSDGTSNILKGIEARIPWSKLYETNFTYQGNNYIDRYGSILPGQIVPSNAVIRLFANIHNNDPASSYSSSDAIPVQTSGNASYLNGLLTTDNYIDIPIDADTNGIPDVLPGDVNAPWLKFLSGIGGKRLVFAQFNEPINYSTALIPGSWDVGGNTPSAVVSSAAPNSVELTLTNDLPSAGTLVYVGASNVQDTVGNFKYTVNALFPVASGLSSSLTVRFVVETASGLGINPGASNFFINGGQAPLEFGFPPATSSPLAVFSGSQYFRDVTYPPGSPIDVTYKYSGQLTTGGTNTYEAIRLTDYSNPFRVLTLNTNVSSMIVTDYLGAAGAPYRNPATNAGYNALYLDPQRGDAGVRQRTTITFQLDMRNRNLAGVSRIMVLGSDPLRGFNANNEPTPISDFGTAPGMSWNTAGLQLFDNGSNGDTNSGDGIYARLWVFATNGYDDVFVVDSPFSLVGGGEFDEPYFGDTLWVARRSPRSFAYKFYVLKTDTSVLESPAANIEHYIQGDPTNVAVSPFVWDNSNLPLPPPSNSPTVIAVGFTNGNARILFTNQISELQHGVQISTNLVQGWLDYGQRSPASTNGIWTSVVVNVNNRSEMYRTFAGSGNPADPLRAFWTPNPIPATGATLRVTFNQNYLGLAGRRDPRWFGRITTSGFTNLLPMVFSNQGVWDIDIVVPPATNNSVQFLFVDPALTIFDKTFANKDFYVNVGGKVTWTPEMPTQSGPFSVTYNTTNTVLAGATQVLFHHGFDNFGGVTMPKMTNLLGTNLPGIWEITVTVSNIYSNAVDWVFQNGSNIFDNNANQDWRAFIKR